MTYDRTMLEVTTSPPLRNPPIQDCGRLMLLSHQSALSTQTTEVAQPALPRVDEGNHGPDVPQIGNNLPQRLTARIPTRHFDPECWVAPGKGEWLLYLWCDKFCAEGV